MYKAHLFICTAAPEQEGRCGNKKSDTLVRQLRSLCLKEDWGPEVRINASGCLGYCQRGISAVLYPKGQWFFNLSENDSEKIFMELKSFFESEKK